MVLILPNFRRTPPGTPLSHFSCVSDTRTSWAQTEPVPMATNSINYQDCKPLHVLSPGLSQSPSSVLLVKRFSLEQSSHQWTRGKEDTMRAHPLPEAAEAGWTGPGSSGNTTEAAHRPAPTAGTQASFGLLSRRLCPLQTLGPVCSQCPTCAQKGEPVPPTRPHPAREELREKVERGGEGPRRRGEADSWQRGRDMCRAGTESSRWQREARGDGGGLV